MKHIPAAMLPLAVLILAPASTLHAQSRSDTAAYSDAECPSCRGWNTPTSPVHLHGNTYYVGTRGLASILIASPDGHVLIDGGLPESAPLIIASVRSLGFSEKDVKLILNSHSHYDHAGGLAALQRMSGAAVAVSQKSASVIRSGLAEKDDPQYGIALAFPAVRNVQVIESDTLRLGGTNLVAHSTAGHTTGGTSWSWRSCELNECVDFVYADSQTPVSADGFKYTRSAAYPTAIHDFERGLRTLAQLSCDILITPHPGASNLWNRVNKRDGASLVDPEACRRYAASTHDALERRKSAEERTP